MSVATFPTTIPAEAESPSPSLWGVGITSSVAAAAAAEILALAARIIDVPMRAADPGGAAAKTIPVGGVAMAVLMNATLGLLIAVALARWAKAPARTFAVVAGTYATLSLLGPVFATHTQLATKVVLSTAHVLAAVVIIPRVTVALPTGTDRRDGAARHIRVRR